ncbi:hypothetical protein ZWY2020_045356 [Hordeum vulgare]|nr:hypothetical protein ZWY2020_045356 [Hordeum vulgare]
MDQVGWSLSENQDQDYRSSRCHPIYRWGRACPWTDLPPDLILGVSGHLQNPADIVRFHAVCRPWRDAAAPAATLCLPWVLTFLRRQHGALHRRLPSPLAQRR